ncbi:SET domain-containing protein 4 [Talaromyces islandicus]|uniref:SET domain-containing protein 4 n=1 Tax=Talaromyces islandicus TaxID=28573 RepID=A0A0U1LKN1_TALIS|nr:SET domain-containing protein 4 [Talaromyces islandicus]
MASFSSPGEEHTSFMQWSLAQGVEINGVEPARFPGRGLGMVASRDIQANEVMVSVPVSVMLSVDTIPRSFIDLFVDHEIPLQGLLAAFLTHGKPEALKKYSLWKATWPTRQDFEDTMPILWPEKLRVSNSSSSSPVDLTTSSITLPPAASGLWNTFRKRPLVQGYKTKHQNQLAQQEKRLQAAWKGVIAVFPDTDWDTFVYYWLIVNTRCFYYVKPGEEPPEDVNEAMTLVPFADYFNHKDDAQCDVEFDGEKYTFQATKSYEKGEEIYMSYGAHPNDLLLIEYGFFLQENESDTLYLDDIIFRDLTTAEKEELIFQQYYGNYQITPESGPCFRTEVAASMKCMSRRAWQNYIQGRGNAAPNSVKVNSIIRGWIEVYLKEASVTIENLEAMLKAETVDSTISKIKVLIDRWNQIKHLCDETVSKLD